MHKLGSLAIAIALVACVSTPGPETEVGESVYTASVQTIAYQNLGGGWWWPPAACGSALATYTLTLADHQLAWEVCEGSGDPATYALRVGARALDDAEWQGLQPTLAALVVDGGHNCAYDSETRALRVTADDIEVEYGDGVLACAAQGRPVIVGRALGGLEGAFNALSLK